MVPKFHRHTKMYWLGYKDKPLSNARQDELIVAYHKADDNLKPAIRNELISSNYGTIISIAKKYKKPYQLFSEDLFNEGVLGLCKALEKYNPKFSNSFTTYATYWIDLYILTFIKHNSKSVTITEYANYKLQKMKRKYKVIPESTDFKTRQITELYSEDEKFDPAIHSDYTISLDNGILKENREEVLNEILKTFPIREKVVLRCRYNLANLKRMNLHEIGAFFKITSECVRQIERRALKRLRARFIKLGIIKRKDFIDD